MERENGKLKKGNDFMKIVDSKGGWGMIKCGHEGRGVSVWKKAGEPLRFYYMSRRQLS